MEITQIYAIAAGGAVLLLMIMNAMSSFKHGLQSLNIVRSKYLAYPLVVRRHRYVGQPCRHYAPITVHLAQWPLPLLSRGFSSRGGEQSGYSVDD